MDMAGTGGESFKREAAVEHPEGVTVERVTLSDLHEHRHAIGHLMYNVIAESEEDGGLKKKFGMHEREEQLRPVAAEFRSGHEAIYLAKDGDEVVGLMAIGLHNGEAVLEECWSVKPERSQKDIVSALVHEVHRDLHEGSGRVYPHLRIPLGEGGKVSKALLKLQKIPQLARFIIVEEAEHGSVVSETA